MRRILISAMLLALLASSRTAEAQTVVGQTIRDFTLPDLDNKFHSAKDYRGKALVLWLFGYN